MYQSSRTDETNNEANTHVQAGTVDRAIHGRHVVAAWQRYDVFAV